MPPVQFSALLGPMPSASEGAETATDQPTHPGAGSTLLARAGDQQLCHEAARRAKTEFPFAPPWGQ